MPTLTIGTTRVPLRHMWQWLKRWARTPREFRTYRVTRCSALCPFRSADLCCYPGQGARDIPFTPYAAMPEWCPLRKQTLAVYYEAPSE